MTQKLLIGGNQHANSHTMQPDLRSNEFNIKARSKSARYVRNLQKKRPYLFSRNTTAYMGSGFVQEGFVSNRESISTDLRVPSEVPAAAYQNAPSVPTSVRFSANRDNSQSSLVNYQGDSNA